MNETLWKSIYQVEYCSLLGYDAMSLAEFVPDNVKYYCF